DRTDELPVLDLRAYEAAAHDQLAETSVQPVLSVEEAVAEPRAGAEDPLQTAVANLREAQELLAGRGARLAEIERALEEARGARAAAELRAGQLTQELTATRAAAGQREAELGVELERARAAAGQQASDLAEELAAAREASEQLRTRATTYFESLQSAERRRSLLEGLLSDLHDEIDAQESGHARMTRELAGRDVRAGELESDLSERAARIAALDSQVATLGAALRQRDVEHESALSEARNHRATLEAELAAERGGGEGRAQELARVRGEAQESADALRAARLECSGHLASIAAGEARVKQLEDRMAEQVQMRRTLQTAADAAVARAHELEADVRAAEENIARLESQLRGRDARVAELEKANQQWRHTQDDKRAAHAATGTRPAPREEAHAEAGAVAREPAPEGAKRLLIRSEGGREVVHVLGRKTTIGRTAENDLQIDIKHISRHHAVILAGPAHTIIEDLNSTNGVMVNGRRITRQILNDGDRVTIARTEYRFALRRNGEKR
ncbi:MAG TPA: FHA domain-containing protein, partial [Steroidobacteraceae bacterium]